MALEPEFKMALPATESYKDLHGGVTIPPITLATLSAYLAAFDKTIDKPCKDLYELGFINFIRTSHFVADKVYFRAECRASMKFHVVYLIDILVDSEGFMVNSQCECGAGMGPNAHCKRVCSSAWFTKIPRVTCIYNKSHMHSATTDFPPDEKTQ